MHCRHQRAKVRIHAGFLLVDVLRQSLPRSRDHPDCAAKKMTLVADCLKPLQQMEARSLRHHRLTQPLRQHAPPGTAFYDAVLQTLESMKVNSRHWHLLNLKIESFARVNSACIALVAASNVHCTIQAFAAFGKDLERQRHVVIAVRYSLHPS